MYVPSAFAVHDLATLHDFIERHSFALLVTLRGGEPLASHLPLLLDRERGPQGTLVGHVARANPQWADASNGSAARPNSPSIDYDPTNGAPRLAADGSAMVVFSGPHSYISPAWYAERNVVPTWNYVAVHVYGRMRLISDRARLHELLRRTVDRYESTRATPWSIDQPEPEFVDRLLDQIVGLEIEIERLEGKWKLSQNQSVERRRRVIEALEGSSRDEPREIAALMRREFDAN